MAEETDGVCRELDATDLSVARNVGDVEFTTHRHGKPLRVLRPVTSGARRPGYRRRAATGLRGWQP